MSMQIKVILKDESEHIVEQDLASFKEVLTLMPDIGFIQDVEGWEFHAREVVKFKQVSGEQSNG